DWIHQRRGQRPSRTLEYLSALRPLLARGRLPRLALPFFQRRKRSLRFFAPRGHALARSPPNRRPHHLRRRKTFRRRLLQRRSPATRNRSMIPQPAIDLILSDEGLDQPGKWPGGESGITIG